MAEIKLAAQTGRATGTRSSRRLRGEGKVPATLYGMGKDAVAITVEWRELRQALVTDAGLNAVIDLSVDGAASELTIVKDLQRHPIRRDVLHVDFLRVDADVAIEVEVPITLTGEASEVLGEGGVVDQVLFHLTVSAKPGAIPDEITVDVSGLAIGDSIRVGDLQLPAGAATHVDAEEPVVTGQPPQREEGEEGAEGEAGAEGAPSEGATSDAEGAPSDEGGGDGDGGGDSAGEG